MTHTLCAVKSARPARPGTWLPPLHRAALMASTSDHRPRALATASAARVRSLISSRSFGAMAA